MMIEVLYFEGCPNLEPTVSLANEVLGELRREAELVEVEVPTAADAERLRFLGSPTVRVDGKDIEPGAETRTDYALSCRMYADRGVPPKELLVAALRAGK